jgi:hypothetical protein
LIQNTKFILNLYQGISDQFYMYFIDNNNNNNNIYNNNNNNNNGSILNAYDAIGFINYKEQQNGSIYSNIVNRNDMLGGGISYHFSSFSNFPGA